jgi:hypothetical protein
MLCLRRELRGIFVHQGLTRINNLRLKELEEIIEYSTL